MTSKDTPKNDAPRFTNPSELRAFIQAQKDKLPVEPVVLSEWNDATLYVKTLNGAQKDTFDAEITDDEGKLNLENFRAKLLAHTLCIDEAGNVRVYEKPEDGYEELGQLSALTIAKLYKVAKRLNGMDEKEGAEKK